MRRVICLCALSILSAQTVITAADRPDLVIADFEGDNYGEWRVEGEAFGKAPARGTLPGQMQVDGYQGKGLVNSFLGGDAVTGTLTSPEFTINRPYLSFLIGGGGWEGKTCLNLLLDGKVIRTAVGPNTKPGGSERLERQRWDVRELEGKKVQLQIVDSATGGWGHINIDHLILSDSPPPATLLNAERSMAVEKRYMHLPIKNGAPQRKVQVMIDGKTERFFDIELADGEPDWWALLDVSAWQGKTAVVRVDRLADDSLALKQIRQSDALPETNQLYREKLRPQFHFSAQRGWINDPNGLVYYKGEYHLFFQHNPYGWNWGNMHWGHATSPDLVQWKEHGEALYPDDMGPMFSGSAVVDWNNTSGLGSKDNPPLIMFYTAAGTPTVQGMAYSTDGRTFKKYEGNPILKQITAGNRDPKVVWHKPTDCWVMVLYVTQPADKHTVQFFTSPNLRDWTFASETVGGTGSDRYLFECPDFFELEVVGEKESKWVLTAANSEYVLGSFDGKTFNPETGKLPGIGGQGFYAAQTYSDEPKKRRVQIGWGQMPSPGMSFNQMQTIPCELSLRRYDQGLRLCRWPVDEVNALRGKKQSWSDLQVPSDSNPLSTLQGDTWDMLLNFAPGQTGELLLDAAGTEIILRPAKGEVECRGHKVKCLSTSGLSRVRVLVDQTSLEIFANDGDAAMIVPAIQRDQTPRLSLRTQSGTITLKTLDVYEMQSAWK